MILKIKNKDGVWVGIPAITGVGIDAVNKEEKENGNVITIVLTDGQETTFVIENGVDGVTPHIGDNGNWFIGDKDTGILADADIITAGVKSALAEVAKLHAQTSDKAVQASDSANDAQIYMRTAEGHSLSASNSAGRAESAAERAEAMLGNVGDIDEALDNIIAMMEELAPTAFLPEEEEPLV